jgi:hypothetical protein
MYELVSDDCNHSKSSERQETMLVETLIKLTELQRSYHAQYAAAAIESVQSPGLSQPGEPPPIPGLSQAAQDAINATAYGSTQLPPDYNTATEQTGVISSL